MSSTLRIVSALFFVATSVVYAGKPSNPAAQVVLADSDSDSADDLDEGEYFRPTGTQVSGFPNATAPYLRCPCPALNTLANHGYLSRDGKDITPAMIKQAIMTVYNIEEGLAKNLTDPLPKTFTLATLSTHNFIEHDVSLVHADEYYKNDPSAVDVTLWTDLLQRQVGGKIGVTEMAAAHVDRYNRCTKKPDGCDFDAKRRTTALGEAALVLSGLGDKATMSISTDHASSFLSNERIPDDYKKPETPLTSVELAATIVKLGALSESTIQAAPAASTA